MKKDEDYIVQAGKVHFIDDVDGQTVASRNSDSFLQQAVEEKEGVNLTYRVEEYFGKEIGEAADFIIGCMFSAKYERRQFWTEQFKKLLTVSSGYPIAGTIFETYNKNFAAYKNFLKRTKGNLNKKCDKFVDDLFTKALLPYVAKYKLD